MPVLGATAPGKPINAGWHTVARVGQSYRPATTSERVFYEPLQDASGSTNSPGTWIVPVDPADYGGTGGVDVRLSVFVVQGENAMGAGWQYQLTISRGVTYNAMGSAPGIAIPPSWASWNHLLIDSFRDPPGFLTSQQYATNSFNLPAGSPRGLGVTITCTQAAAASAGLFFSVALQVLPSG